MWRIGWRSFGGIVWFGWRDSEEQCLDTIAYNQRLDYDAGEDVSYVYEEVKDVYERCTTDCVGDITSQLRPSTS